jgi:hypothetical protein
VGVRLAPLEELGVSDTLLEDVGVQTDDMLLGEGVSWPHCKELCVRETFLEDDDDQ